MQHPNETYNRNRSTSSLSQSVTHERPAYGSRLGISQLPSLPTDNWSQPTQLSSDDEADATGGSLATNATHDDTSSSFIEFDLGKRFPKDHGIRASLRNPGVTPQLPINERSETERLGSKDAKDADFDFFADDMATWKTMKTVTEQDYYDEKGNLEFSSGRDHDRFDPKNVNGGYTRIDTAEQVAKYAEMDKKTDFLFVTKDTDKQEVAKYRHEDNNEDSDDDILYDEVETMETADALQSTREMLNEGQKFSYVGIVKLIMVDMAAELAGIKQSTTSKVARQLSASQKNFANWSMYISGKVYSHLNVNEDEQKMIENLSIHGVNVSDLTSSLVKEDDRKPGPLSLDWVLVCDLFLLLLSDGYYDSRSRALLMRFANELAIEKIEVFQFERRLLNSLELETKDKSLEDKEDKLNDKQIIQKYIKRNKGRRMAYIGLATVGGTLAIGLSAGLLAPVIGAGLAAGLTTVGIGGTSGFLAGVGGTTIITTGGVMLGAKVGSKAGMRRAGDVETFELKPLHNNKRSNLIITVSGWMTGKSDDVRLPFSTVDPVMGDLFSVLWEPEMLKSMGQTISILASEALTSSIQQILGATILTSLMAAIQIPVALSKLSYLVDNPWNVSLDRAWKAGKILADTLVSGNLGVRPMTLVGFSLGSRVIYSCLVELAQKGCFGLVENVIILGTPITINKDQLGLARSVVSGKFINGYSRKDWVLGYLFRATGGGLASVAGIAPINDSYGIENIDVTEFVEGHMAYRKAIPKILQELQWEVLDEEFAEIEEPDNEEGERQRQLIHEFDEARAKMKKEIEDEQKEQTEKKGWKKFFSRRQNNWWSDIGESSDTTGEEYIEQENPTPIFDVGSLLKEAKEIEHLSIPDKSQLPQEVPITKPVSESKLESKPEQKPVLTSISETVAQKSTQLKHKASDMLSKPSESSLDKA